MSHWGDSQPGGIYGECGHGPECPGDGPDCWPACQHDWLARPESDTRECLICGAEASGA